MSRSKRPKVTESMKTTDLLVYNDSNVLALYSASIDQKANPIQSEKDAVERELGFILPLCQDDSYVMRVKLGPPSAAEKREFIGLAAGHVDLSSGILIAGEASVQVPKEKYRLEVRSYLPHSMACWQLERANNKSEKLGSYFRRTRPGESFPEWLTWICWSHPADDPGHEKEWRALKTIDEMTSAYVDFLVCLLPASSKKPVSKMKKNGIAEWQIRCPDVCPKGIKAQGVSPEGMDGEFEDR